MASQPVKTRSERDELFEHVESWATFVLANLLWAVASIPLVTLPAATAGLFAVMMARARGEQPNTIGLFVSGMRQHWRKASGLMALNLLGGGLVAANVVIFPLMDVNADPLAFAARSVTLFAALALLMLNVYAWPLLVLLDELPLKQVLESAARLAFGNLLWSLGVVLAAVAMVAFSMLLPRGILALATASGVTLVVSMGAWRVIREHLRESV